MPFDRQERFMRLVSPEPMSGCWLWMGAVGTGGYGQFEKGHTRPAHRVAYEMLREPIPVGLHLDHLCRVRCCVNPWHLEPVSPAENNRRGIAGQVNGARQKAKTHCPRGHLYDASNTYTYGVNRHCRECHRNRETIRREKRKLCRSMAKVSTT